MDEFAFVTPGQAARGGDFQVNGFHLPALLHKTGPEPNILPFHNSAALKVPLCLLSTRSTLSTPSTVIIAHARA